jgi:hypothetical protein
MQMLCAHDGVDMVREVDDEVIDGLEVVESAMAAVVVFVDF